MERAISFLLVSLALFLLLQPESAFWIAGFRHLKTPDSEELDRLSKQHDSLPTPFFTERNALEVKVPHAMRLDKFLRLYQIDLPHIRKHITRQLGIELHQDSYRLKGKERFTIELTPPEDEEP
jgi:hypothetical protein